MLHFGIRAHDFGTLPAETLAERLEPFKPASIQLALAKALSDTPSKTGSLSPGYARRLRECFSRKGIAISVLGCYFNPVHPDPVAREKGLCRFEEHLRFARDFGCAIVGTETGSINPDCTYHPDTALESTFDLFCDSVSRLVRTAECYGSIVGIEPVAGQHTVDSIEKTVRLIERIDSPNLQIIWDPVNLIPTSGLDESQESFFTRALDAFGDHIVAVHIKDFRMENGVKNGTLVSGTGDLDYPALFRLLQERKPWVDALIENGIPEKMHETLAFLRRIERDTSH
jgi:L-ribulose-5-phosphate 3-epimerase